MPRPRVRSLVVLVAVILVATVGVVACYTPPLRMTVSHRVARVDVQTLGEYPTDVERLRLIDASTGAVVWELRSRGARAQLATFELRAGTNSAMVQPVQWGKFDVVIPSDTKTFEIQTGKRYTLEVWGTGLSLTRRRTTFTLS
jgi:hypothetical protein